MGQQCRIFFERLFGTSPIVQNLSIPHSSGMANRFDTHTTFSHPPTMLAIPAIAPGTLEALVQQGWTRTRPQGHMMRLGRAIGSISIPYQLGP